MTIFMQQEKTAVVTGSSTGNGFETSLMLARNGFYTYATMRNVDKSEGIVDVARKDGLPLEVLQLDVTDDKSVKDAIDTIFGKRGRIDVVVNNAGYDAFGAVEDLSVEEIKAQFETNFFGAIRVMKAVLPTMRKQRTGTIVNVSSAGGLVGIPLNSAYISSKFALEGFSESMQYELEEFGIKVILIEPGVVKTNFFENSKPPKNTTSSNSPYSELAKKVFEGFKPMLENNSSSPIHVAQVILKAITSEKPHTRYLVGNDAAAIMDKKRSSSDIEFQEWIKESLIQQKGFFQR
jgi:NAD(P)-dependent dehydrogenase (short-subunit alcohol dehydrogenase family)